MILIVDNFDSFTYNLADYFSRLGVKYCIVRNNISMEEILRNSYDGIVFSPGSGIPAKAGNMMEFIQHYHNLTPMLGICLGHQGLGQYFGASLIKAQRPMHGKISKIVCEEGSIFSNIPSQINVVRYHSLILDKLPPQLKILATTEQGEIMAFKHEKWPIYGIQFHPESILTEHGLAILENWVMLNKISD